MKKYITLPVVLLVVSTLFSCGPKTPDIYTMPVAPTPPSEDTPGFSVSVESVEGLSALLGISTEKTGALTLGGSIDVGSEILELFFDERNDTARSKTTVSFSPEGSYVKLEDGETEAQSVDLYARYFGERVVSDTLRYIGVQRGGYVYQGALLSRIGKFGDLMWEGDMINNTKTALVTVDGEQMAQMLEAEGAESQIARIMRVFYSRQVAEDAPIDEIISRLREDKSLHFTQRLIVNYTSGRVLINDITVRSNSTVFSLVYDGSTADLSVTVRHKNEGMVAVYSSKHEDSRTTYTLRSTAGEETRGVRIVLTDGSVYGEITATERDVVQASFKYDSTRRELVLRSGENILSLCFEGESPEGSVKIGERTLALAFSEAEHTDSGVRYAVTRIGDADAPSLLYVSINK